MAAGSRPPAPGRILVVGCGFIGRHLVARALEAGREVVVLTRSAPTECAPEAEVVVADAADAAVVRQVLGGVTDVFYAAGGLMPAESEKDPARDAALSFPPLLAVLQAVVERGATFTLISSGGTVYGEPLTVPVPESHPTNPISAYGVVKLAEEKFVTVHGVRDGLRTRILRCSNVYGEGQPSDRGQGAVATFVAHLFDGEPITLYGDGGVVRDYAYVGDIATAAIRLSASDEEQLVVNVGSGQGHSLRELIGVIEHVSGEALRVDRRPARDFDVSAIVLDISRARSLFDFAPTPLEQGVRRVVAAERTRRGEGVPARRASVR